MALSRGIPDNRSLEEKRADYLNSILILMITISLFVLISTVGTYILLINANKAQEAITQNQKSITISQQLIKDCVDERRAGSKCQQYANKRTNSAVSVLQSITEAYVLCADKLDGDDAIKRCVARRLTS